MVILKHMNRKTGRDTKPHAAIKDTDPEAKDGHSHKRPVLTELIEEIMVDTTPSKNQVQSLLGGPFSFLGQYPDEGVVLMARRELPADLEVESVHKLRELCKEYGIDTTLMLEKAELAEALLDAQLPVNPHQLQPPLDGIVVRGDILLVKVADTEEELDKDDEKEDEEEKGGADAATEPPKITVPTNEEFFLNYSKKEWVAFASRTDVVAPELSDDDEEEEVEDDDDDDEEEDDDYDVTEKSDDDDDEEDDRKAMLNLIMGEVLKRFREENGRGPDTRELLQLRSQVADQLGVEVATFEEDGKEEDDDAKRSAAEPAEGEGSSKKVKFSGQAKKEDDEEGKEEDAGEAKAGGEQS